MSILLLQYILGIILGVGSSLVAWWVLFHCITPNIRFADGVSKTESSESPCGFVYRVKFENAGRRTIVDLEISACLSIVGLRADRPRNREETYLPVSFQGKIPVFGPAKKTGHRALIRVWPQKREEFGRSVYPEQIRHKSEQDTIMFDDLLGLGTDAWLELTVTGYDEFSGARKVFVSRGFRKKDIIPYPFVRESLEFAYPENDKSS